MAYESQCGPEMRSSITPLISKKKLIEIAVIVPEMSKERILNLVYKLLLMKNNNWRNENQNT